MKIDLHNHTSLCNHATGTVEEYVKKAIKENIDIFGFSDHAPMNFDPKYRMYFDDMKNYINTILHIKEKYAGDIEILKAYEVDFLPGHMDKRVLDADVDYLIGSVHFIDEWGFDNPEFIGQYKHKDIDAIWQRYFDLIEQMATSNLFDIVGHIDLIKVFKYLPKKNVSDIANQAIKAIKKADMVIEINVAGYRKPINEAYPSRELLEMAFDAKIPITFGSDAHSPEQVGLFRDEAEAFARSIGYKKSATFRNRKRELLNF
ncbi:MAG: histidinol-phosphatase [Campylobacterota bacterium]|nr:histidinol-phosphatase [Campylobacterota bacterium]